LVFNNLPMNQIRLPIYTGFVFVLAVDLLYDLVHPHIAAGDFYLLDSTSPGDHLYQYRQKPLSPDPAWHIQGSGGTAGGPVPNKRLDPLHTI